MKSLGWTEAPVYLQCIHTDVWLYPTTRINLEVGCHKEKCPVSLAKMLAYPVVPGRDCRWFGEVMQEWGS